jgi:hypothetical protein
MRCEACTVEDPTVKTWHAGTVLEHTLCSACRHELSSPPIDVSEFQEKLHEFKFKKRLEG